MQTYYPLIDHAVPDVSGLSAFEQFPCQLHEYLSDFNPVIPKECEECPLNKCRKG